MSALADRTWDGLLRAALLGTERNPPPAAPPGDAPLARALAAAVAVAAGESPEATLLSAAAIVAAHRRAARAAARDDRPAAEPSPGETRPVCPPLAARHLAMMLDGVHRAALPEWMEAAARAGFIIPPELLPALFDAVAHDDHARVHLADVAGERGRWLANHKVDWLLAFGPRVRQPSEDEDRNAWETLPADARPRILAKIRGRDPARGLALLQSTWASEAARDRAKLVEALEPGLSMDDEPFLESALDDRRKEVRTAAAAMLARIAGSRLVSRMTERARQWLFIAPAKTGLLAMATGGGAPSIDLRLPEAVDKAMERDGVAAKPPYGWGERAWWLAQVVGAVPPRAWSDAARCTPAELIAAANKTEWRDVLVNAWAAAAIRHRDAEWAEPLVTRLEGAQAHLGDFVSSQGLFAVLPPARAEAVMLAVIRPMRVLDQYPPVQMLAGLEHRWSPELTAEVLRRSSAADPSRAYMLRETLTAAVPRMHVGAALDVIRTHGDALPRQWVDLLQHRHDMLEALKR